MKRLKLLTTRHRTPGLNRTLGYVLAFNAGALNAGGFLVLHTYTSHMTGFVSQFADSLVMANTALLLGALGAFIAFLLGAATSAIIVVRARQTHLRSVYALPLVLEAGLLVPFGLAGMLSLSWQTPFAVPATVLLLSFIMGLQNALGSKTSGGSVRTTHMTGNVTDLGIEVGRAVLQWQQRQPPQITPRMRQAAGLLLMFVVGGTMGALGFTRFGFICVLPLATLLLCLALPPLAQDLRALARRRDAAA